LSVSSFAVILVLAGYLLLASPVLAQNENETVGFSPTHIFDGGYFGENIDTLNGNLNLTIPIGPTYQVNKNLSYQLKLYYNSRVWEFQDTSGLATRSNLWGESPVGLGFNLGFGRLYQDYDEENAAPVRRWQFVTPDGNRHDMGAQIDPLMTNDTTYYLPETLRESGSVIGYRITNGTGIRYTLRHKASVPDTSSDWCRWCDWNDRNKAFAGWYVTLIEDITSGTPGGADLRYPNWVEIQYEAGSPTPATNETGYGQCISLVKDSAGRELRFHNQRLVAVPGDPGSRRIQSIEVPKFSASSTATASFATYSFDHVIASVPVPFYNVFESDPPTYDYDTKRSIVRLSTIQLPNDDAMRFEYSGLGGSGSALTARSLPLNQLPLDGNGKIQGPRMEYEYSTLDYFKSVIRSDGATGQGKIINGQGAALTGSTLQISEKRLYLIGDPLTNPSVKWKYNRVVPMPGGAGTNPGVTNPSSVILTTIQSNPAALNETVYYFRASINPDVAPPSSADSLADGKAPDWDDGLLYRTEYWEGKASEGRLLRVEEALSVPDILSGFYITKNNIRPYRNATTYVEDGGKQVVVENTDWDGQGHWRITTETGYGMSAPRITRKQFNPHGLHNDTYDYVEVSDGATVFSRSDYAYDAVGRLTTTRDRKTAPATLNSSVNVTPVNGDVLTTYTYDANGNVNQKTTSSTDPLSTPPTSTHTVTYGYSAGGYLQTKQFSGMPWKSIDWHRDVNTGLIFQSCDTAGICTNYDYDELGRIRKIIPTAPEFVSAITYPSLKETTVWQSSGAAPDPNTACSAAEDCIYSRYLYDDMARLIETQKRDFAGNLVHQVTAYDALSNVSTKSEWAAVSVTDPPKTLYSYIDPITGAYDPFGRVHRVTTPDSKITDTAYRGQDTTVTIQGISAAGGLTSIVSTTYSKDALGRLIEVSRPSSMNAANGQALPGNAAGASYRYDMQDNLVQVDLIASDFTRQVRTFAYDALGHLTQEENPENGTIQYNGYDDLGSLRRKVDNAGNTFLMSYDAAGRLLQTKRGTVLLVQNTYDQATVPNVDPFGASSGKLTTVESYADTTTSTLELTQKYYYSGLNGRPSGESTKFPEAAPTFKSATTYNNFGLPSILTYPTEGTERLTRGIQNSYKNGFLRSVSDGSYNPPLAIVQDLQYNPAGGLSQILTVGNVRDTVTADSRNRPARIQVEKIDPATGNSLVPYWDTGAYQYDGAGNIREIGATGGSHLVFGYDDANRLVSATIEKGSRPAIVEGSSPPRGDPTVYLQGDYTLSFGYDSFGNLTRRDEGMTDSRRQFAVNPLTNRLQAATTCHISDQCAGSPVNRSVLYDTNGNVVQDEEHTFEVDARNRVLRVRNISGGDLADESRYDPAGFRVIKRSENSGLTTFYIRNREGQVLSEFTRPTSSTADPLWHGDYVYAAGRVIAMTERDKPDPPAGLYIQSVTGCPANGSQATVGVTLTWQRSLEADVTGYEVYRDGVKISTTDVPVANPTLPDSVLSGVTYNYQVRAKDPLAMSDLSLDYRANLCHTAAPTAPTLQSAVAGDGRVSLSWSVSTTSGPNNLLGYHISRVEQSGGACPPPAGFSDLNSTPLTGTTYVDVTVDNGKTYCYLVKARNTAGTRSAASNIVAATPLDTDGPATPRNFRAHTGCPGAPVSFIWDRNTEPDRLKYTIYRSNLPDLSGAVNWDVMDASLTFPVINDPLSGGAPSGQVFYYAIRAFDNRNNPSPLSPIIRVALRNPATQIPGSLTGAAGSARVQLSWTHPGTAHRFVVYRRPYGGTCADYQQVFIGELNPQPAGSFSFTDLFAENFKAYEYTVSALDASGINESNDAPASAQLVPVEAPNSHQQCWSPFNIASAYVTLGTTWPHVSIADRVYDSNVAAAAGRGYVGFVGYTTWQPADVQRTQGGYTDWNNKTFQDVLPSVHSVPLRAVYKINDWKYCDTFLPPGATYCTGYYSQDEAAHPDCGNYDVCLALGRSHLPPPYGSYYNPAGNPTLLFSEPVWIYVPSSVEFAATQNGDSPYTACSTLWPPRPNNIRGTHVGPGEILVEWDAPSGDLSQVTGYQLFVVDGPPNKPIELPSSAPRSVTLTGQHTCAGTYVYVDSANLQRVSSRRPGAYLLEQITIPPHTEPPGSFQLTPGPSDGTIIVSWSAPSDLRCVMPHVEIKRKLGANETILNLSHTAGPYPSRQSYTDTGLTPGADYTYEFRASYQYYAITEENGWGPVEVYSDWTPPIAVRAPGGSGGVTAVLYPAPPPTAPPVVAGGSGTATVTWTAPASGPTPDGYRLYYWTNRHRRLRLWNSTGLLSGTSANVTGLEPGQAYHFALSAVRWDSPPRDDDGGPRLLESGQSATSAPFTLAATLMPPTNVTAEAGSLEGQIIVSWDQAASPATKYFIEDVSDPMSPRRISYLDASGDPTYEVIPSGTGRMSFTMSGLPRRRLFRFVVISSDASGTESAPSQGANAYAMDFPPPNIPFQCIYCGTAPSTIQISWSSAAGDPSVSHYELHRYKWGTNAGGASCSGQVTFDHINKNQTTFSETPQSGDAGCKFTYTIWAVDTEGTHSLNGVTATTKFDGSCRTSCSGMGGDGNGNIWGFTCGMNCAGAAGPHHPEITKGGVQDPQFNAPGLFAVADFQHVESEPRGCQAAPGELFAVVSLSPAPLTFPSLEGSLNESTKTPGEAMLPYRIIGNPGPEDQGGGNGGGGNYIPPSFKWRVFHADHLGTPRIVTDATGNVVSEHAYLPFGEEIPPSSHNSVLNSSNNSHRFTGHERDSETGLDYMMARYYQATLGRFLSVDPGESVRQENGQSWNRYAYVNNNPVGSTDPDGRCEYNQTNPPEPPDIGQQVISAVVNAPAILNDANVMATGKNLDGSSESVGSRLLSTARVIVAGLALALGGEEGVVAKAGESAEAGGSAAPKRGTPAQSLDNPSSLVGASESEVRNLTPGWKESSSKSGGGTRIANPEKRGEQVRMMPGNKRDPNPTKQGPYLRVSKDGKRSDPIPMKGNPVLKDKKN
jgi:RHS repeat-associated protein